MSAFKENAVHCNVKKFYVRVRVCIGVIASELNKCECFNISLDANSDNDALIFK